jgi:RNA polymerase sigma factor (TIGR02999 family)
MNEVTRLIEAIHNGDPKAADDLLPLVYTELRHLARARMSRENSACTLQPTALVHEAWLRLQGPDGTPRFSSRAHFFGAAAEAMRRILIDRARRRAAARHGGGMERCDVDDFEIATPARNDDEILAVHDALDRLAEYDARKAELVKLRYFAGLTIEQAAAVLEISEPTAKRDWQFARAWLAREIGR